MPSEQPRSCVLIPARYAASRYPGKPLVPLLGKPMILWVAERSADAVDLCHTDRGSVYCGWQNRNLPPAILPLDISAQMHSRPRLGHNPVFSFVGPDQRFDGYVVGDHPHHEN